MPKNKRNLIDRKQGAVILFFGFFVFTALFFSPRMVCADNLGSVPLAEALSSPNRLRFTWNPGSTAYQRQYQYMIVQESRYEGYDVVAIAVYRDWTTYNF